MYFHLLPSPNLATTFPIIVPFGGGRNRHQPREVHSPSALSLGYSVEKKLMVYSALWAGDRR